MQYFDPDLKQLRHFGILFSLCLAALFYVIFPFVFGSELRSWPALVSLAFLLIALVWPSGLKSFYVLWMKLALILGRINTTIILSLIFFLLITPMGFVFRLTGALKDSAVDKGHTYRKMSEKRNFNQMEKPY